MKLPVIKTVIAALILMAPAVRADADSHAVVQRVTPKAYSYLPANAAGPAPLIVLLHGAGGDARYFVDEFKRDADARAVMLLSVQSDGRTWARLKPTDGDDDVANIKEAIAGLANQGLVDPNRTTIMGFSDGASYALSVGMAYPDIFRAIVAFSPGYAFAPAKLNTEQRIFIAHSRRDPVLPAENTKRMVEGLRRAGFAPEVHWFNGGHEIDPQLKKAAFDFALRP